MIDYTPAISALETELALLDERRPLIEAALTGLRRLTGDGVVPRSSSRVAKPRKAPKRATKRTDGRTDGRSKGRATVTARGSLPDGPSGVTILDALRAAGGSMKPGALQKQVGLSAYALRAHIAPLIEQHLVEATGATLNRVFSLTTTRSGSEAPAQPPVQRAAAVSTQAPTPAPQAATPPASTMAAGVSLAETRDNAIRARLKQGKATFDELTAMLPVERGESDVDRRDACKRALKRLTLKGVVADVGDKFQLV